jgi:hypothetical protein
VRNSCHLLKRGRQTQAFVPTGQVVGGEQQKEVRLVDDGLPGGKVRQGIVGFQFLDGEFHRSVVVVESVDDDRPDAEVSHERTVTVPVNGGQPQP